MSKTSSLGHSRNFNNPPKLQNQSMQKIGGLPVIPNLTKPVLHQFTPKPAMKNMPLLRPAKTGVNGRPAKSRLAIPPGRP